MTTSTSNSAHRSRPLWRLYHKLRLYEVPYHPDGIQLLDQEMNNFENDTYTSYPDLWHNTAMAAARIRHAEAELAIVQSGLREWPDNVDLLCDELQLRYSTSYNPQRAAEIWDHLWRIHTSTNGKVTGPYWRFWNYGATFHTRIRQDVSTALELLSEGLKHVRRDALMDLYRGYRRVLVDGPPEIELADEAAVLAHQQGILETLEEKYKQGLLLGLENGYVLAQELARLYQERAVTESDLDDEPDGTDSQQNAAYYLQKAHALLEIAERLYTGNLSHPITDIYIAKARIYMAQKQFEDALSIFQALPERSFQEDPSLLVMAQTAALRVGQEFQPKRSSLAQEEINKEIEEGINRKLGEYLTSPQALASIAQQHPEIRSAILQAALLLQRSNDGD